MKLRKLEKVIAALKKDVRSLDKLQTTHTPKLEIDATAKPEASSPGVDGPKDLSDELWREYDFTPWEGGSRRYFIFAPRWLYTGKTTHRVVDCAGVVHCVPTVGIFGCVVRWKPRNTANPVQF